MGGEPVVLVITAPLLVVAAIALLRRPSSDPVVDVVRPEASVREGQAFCSDIAVLDDTDVELVVRVLPESTFVAAEPQGGIVTRASEDASMLIGPRRWGRHEIGEESTALASAWDGFRWGPVLQPLRSLNVLPVAPPYRSRAEAPQPQGLVGAHRSRRSGSGTELDGIRPFQTGDRLRRVHWRVTARTDDLHVTTTRAEQDAGLVLALDLLAEHGDSGGVDGAASSLDLTVRAAAALAEHAVRQGDRVALRPIGGRGRAVGSGAGRRHLARVLGALAEMSARSVREEDLARLDLRVGGGETVLILSPLLSDPVAAAAATLVRHGVPTVVVDVLPTDLDVRVRDADPALVALAWRMRLLERERVLVALAAIGCPVVAWHGAGTVDEVMRRLGRRRPVGRGA